MDTVCAAPVNVTVEVPFANAEPAPVVFQFPETVHEPVVTVNVPLAPPIIDTSEMDTAEAFAASNTWRVMVAPREGGGSRPPDIVSRASGGSASAPLPGGPREGASSPPVVSWLWSVRVPPLTVSAPKDALPPIRRFPVPENVT